MDKAHHLANFKQALYEILSFSPSVVKPLEADRYRNWLHTVSGASSTAQCTARIYAQFMPELKTMFAE